MIVATVLEIAPAPMYSKNDLINATGLTSTFISAFNDSIEFSSLEGLLDLEELRNLLISS